MSIFSDFRSFLFWKLLLLFTWILTFQFLEFPFSFFSEFFSFLFSVFYSFLRKKWHVSAIVDVSTSLTMLNWDFENSLLWSRFCWTYKTGMNSPRRPPIYSTKIYFFFRSIKMESNMMLFTTINKKKKLKIIR